MLSHAELRRVTDDFVALVTAMLDEAGINYLSVSGRTKSVDSFAGKVRRRAAAGTPFADPLTEITDQVGVRVITYVASDVAAVAELLADQLTVLDDRDLGPVHLVHPRHPVGPEPDALTQPRAVGGDGGGIVADVVAQVERVVRRRRRPAGTRGQDAADPEGSSVGRG